MNDDQLFHNYLAMFILWLRSKTLERKCRKLVCGLRKTACSFCLLFCVFPHNLKNLFSDFEPNFNFTSIT